MISKCKYSCWGMSQKQSGRTAPCFLKSPFSQTSGTGGAGLRVPPADAGAVLPTDSSEAALEQ